MTTQTFYRTVMSVYKERDREATAVVLRALRDRPTQREADRLAVWAEALARS